MNVEIEPNDFDVWEKLIVWVILKTRPPPTMHYIADNRQMDIRAVRPRLKKLYGLNIVGFNLDKTRKRYFLTDKGRILAEKLGFCRKI